MSETKHTPGDLDRELGRNWANSEARTRLNKAAPELLATCKQVVGYLTAKRPVRLASVYALQEAIRKAEGKEGAEGEGGKA